MAIRSYFIQIIGTGTQADPFRPAGLTGISWSGHGVPTSGKAFVLADVTPAQHATLIGDAVNVTYLPIEDAGGAVVAQTGTFGDMSAANRTNCKAIMEAQHVPTHFFTLASLIREAFKWVKRRKLLSQQLGVDDFNEGLDTLVSAVPGAKRTAIAAKLTAIGYDTSVIVGPDTIREAIRKLMEQNIAANRTGDE